MQATENSPIFSYDIHESQAPNYSYRVSINHALWSRISTSNSEYKYSQPSSQHMLKNRHEAILKFSDNKMLYSALGEGWMGAFSIHLTRSDEASHWDLCVGHQACRSHEILICDVFLDESIKCDSSHNRKLMRQINRQGVSAVIINKKTNAMKNKIKSCRFPQIWNIWFPNLTVTITFCRKSFIVVEHFWEWVFFICKVEFMQEDPYFFELFICEEKEKFSVLLNGDSCSCLLQPPFQLPVQLDVISDFRHLRILDLPLRCWKTAFTFSALLLLLKHQ